MGNQQFLLGYRRELFKEGENEKPFGDPDFSIARIEVKNEPQKIIRPDVNLGASM
jgi:hypothetical protein